MDFLTRLLLQLPALPGLLLASASLLLITAALLLWPDQPWGWLARQWRAAPRLTGLGAGSLILIGGWALPRNLMFPGPALLPALLALGVALVIGVYLPGLDGRAHAQRRRRLVLQTADFTGYLAMRVMSTMGDDDLLAAYVRRPQWAIRDLQALMLQALTDQQRLQRGNIYDLLLDRAHETGSPALIACCTTLQQGARQSRQQLGPILTQQRDQILDMVIEATRQRAQRIELLLILVCAMSLVFGLITFILYVMTAGGTLLAPLW